MTAQATDTAAPADPGTRLADLEADSAKAYERIERENAEERLSSWRFAAAIGVLFIVGAGVFVAAAVLLDWRATTDPITSVLLIIAVFLFLGAMAGPIIAIAMQRARARHNELSQREFDSIDRAAASIDDEALGDLISFNFRLMDRFINVALGQAKASYLFCAGAATAALLVLLAGTTALLAVNSVSAQVTVGVITAAGVTLSGFISSTFMNVYKMTSRQMSYYYGQPLVHCFLLHAEWLAQRSQPEDPVQHRLIDATLGASRNAQQQLLDLMEVRQSKGG
ncbi:hypothetical protein GCM10010112_78040 [Actinoplanes lobatus]|uniref:Cyanobacterial TRADD-N associated 2 transmembrane domain-containing protein n=1 Tax=Actinoplanes lobatus TaxID=113568 RepID=A0A7W7MKH8_9ACTN|nr:hypothetical protein [Actinoplanes lobatus]MBB4753528.1 hypothetical protein [Actinoplanes lobatus]GGN91644.1 hypothetical protein GCM10010112_78040 [Actinoplanes lobatus]GIE38061.1 hypothetical protein Alo02nite_09590 [Actinoplanes lobatus]